MRLVKARIQNYRSIIDTGEFEIEKLKTILVGPNEAGKTVILKALQQLNKPDDVPGFIPLRDYPRSKFNDLQRGIDTADDIVVVTGWFKLDESEMKLVPEEFKNCTYEFNRKLDNKGHHSLLDVDSRFSLNKLKNDLLRLVAHMDARATDPDKKKPSEFISELTNTWNTLLHLTDKQSTALKSFLETNIIYVEEGNEVEEKRHQDLLDRVDYNLKYNAVLSTLHGTMPVFILFNNYFKVKPSIHLQHLADRVENDTLEDEYYDYGNLCLLKLLGFTPKELADIGNTTSPSQTKPQAVNAYMEKLDDRSYKLNAASVKLTKEIRSVWNPDAKRDEAAKLRVTADGQYLKVVVEDDLGVEVELDQRSEGFQWLVSFFVVFFAEAMDKHKNAILLLDEPGVSLHGLKQREFRKTISRLADSNQTIYSTHSPFLVGPDELNLVRVVELTDRTIGTKVHTTLLSSDPAGLLPLQEALGYDLAQSMFAMERNLVLEGITDYWYIDATASLLRSAGKADLNEKIALVFANTASKVVYYATILHAQKFKVAALLDSDSAGDQAAKQENLVHSLGSKNILRTKDFIKDITFPEIEDLLRATLISIAKTEYNVDVTEIATKQNTRPLINIFESEIENFSKYKLAKAYIRWTNTHEAKNLTEQELAQWTSLIQYINKVLK